MLSFSSLVVLTEYQENDDAEINPVKYIEATPSGVASGVLSHPIPVQPVKITKPFNVKTE